MRTRWGDDRLDDLKQGVEGVKQSVDRLDGRIDRLQQAMIIAVVAMCTMMFAGFGAILTLIATHF